MENKEIITKTNYISKYVDAITKDAQEASEKVYKQIENYKNSLLKKAKNRIKTEQRNEIQAKQAMIREDVGRECSVKDLQKRKFLFEKREEIKSKVFEISKEKLINFTKTDEYSKFLVSSSQEIRKHLFGVGRKVNVFLKEEDLKFSESISEAFGLPCEFAIDNIIQIGGIRVKFSNIIIDDTLDARLNSQSPWFEENSKLEIR